MPSPRTHRALGFAMLVLLAIACPSRARTTARADEPKPSAPQAASAELATWEGFLWVSPEGWTRMGTLITSESTDALMRQLGGWLDTPHVVDAPLASRLASIDGAITAEIGEPRCLIHSLLSADDWTPGRPGEPRVLVKLRGEPVPTVVHLSKPEGADTSSPPVSLRNARLVTIERLDPAWLRAWRSVFRSAGGPWKRESFGNAAAAALAAMRAVPDNPEDVLAAARKVDPQVRSSVKFRHSIEMGVQRFLATESEELHYVFGPGPTDLPPLPTLESRTWWEAPTRAQLIERATSGWKGDLDDLNVSDAVGASDFPRHGPVDLETVRNGWTDARYAENRAKMLEAARGK